MKWSVSIVWLQKIAQVIGLSTEGTLIFIYDLQLAADASCHSCCNLRWANELLNLENRSHLHPYRGTIFKMMANKGD